MVEMDLSDDLLSQEEMDALLHGAGEFFIPEAKDEDSSPNLGMILGFPLKLSVRLGEAKKTLKEVLQIIPGSVVELDNYVNDPVNLFVNGKLIAQGEVVALDESYGVKIMHILDPAARVRQLGGF
jgi:flagellar motor switch protein FliN/FliY